MAEEADQAIAVDQSMLAERKGWEVVADYSLVFPAGCHIVLKGCSLRTAFEVSCFVLLVQTRIVY